MKFMKIVSAGADKENDTDTLSGSEYEMLTDKEKKKWHIYDKRQEHLPRICFYGYGLAAVALTVLIISIISPGFADFFNLHVSAYIRIFFSYLTVWIPFSLAEATVILLPFAFVTIVVYAMRHRCDTWKTVLVFVCELLAVAAVLMSFFILAFGLGYRGASLDNKLGLDREDVSTDDLEDTAQYLASELSQISGSINYKDDGFSKMPYSLDEMNRKLMDAYDKFANDYDFFVQFHSRVKPVMLSEAMSYMHVTGVYTYYTGEANINIGFPDYTIPFTAAHELAHQRGVSREDEASFIAYLVCINSDDPYLRYSGYLNMFEYVGSSLYSADRDKYLDVYEGLPVSVCDEMSAYNDFFEKYEHSVASAVSGAVNDTFLKVQGTEGTKSYGMVVDLAVAYRRANMK